MSMKNVLINSILILLTLVTVCSCDDSFLNVTPETEITSESFFKSPEDLKIYCNKFYPYLSCPMDDRGSDNVVAKNITNETAYRMMRGLISPQNAGQWYGYWSRMREINYFLENSHKAVGNADDINHYIGVGRFFRAWYYYTLVEQYSDLPWYNRSLQTTDNKLLYKKQDPRSLVVDSVFADFQFAVDHIKPNVDGNVSKTTMTKWSALAWMARFALNEGTMRKYHTELGLADDYTRFLQLAVNASQEIMDSGVYSIYTVNGTGERSKAYESLFNSTDLSKNPEIIMCRDYDKTLNLMHDAKSVFNQDTGLSRDLLEDYLAYDDNGNLVPFNNITGYQTMSYTDVFKNRDPRMAQTFMYPGFKMPGYSDIAYPNLNIGGYLQIKFYPTTADQIALGSTAYTDVPIFRYAEVLLINAEAKAELGTLTQDDLDKTIKLLRNRVGMPAPVLSDWLSNIDPVLEAKYPNVSGPMKGAILETRRERRIEMACEGLRLEDLKRWKAGQLAAVTPKGIYVSALGPVDITGDGIPEYYISVDGTGLSDIKKKYPGANIISYNLNSSLFSLSEGTKGYIQITDQVNSFNFLDKYYYYPIDVRDLTANPNLYQNPLWK
jgi:starch-binding outer membrane protein, SusD/RagB family